MARTIGDVVSDIRLLLKDEDSDNYRYSDDVVYRMINNAMSDIRRLRPDVFLPSTFSTSSLLTAPTQYTSADNGVAFPIEETYVTAVIDYVVGYINMGDDEYVADGTATSYGAKLAQKLIGIGA